jgi:hypothetical protein
LGYAKEPFDPGGRKTVGLNIGVQFRAKENLIRVNVPNPCDRLLMHEQRFQPASSALEEPMKILRGHRQGIVTESAGDVPIETFLVQQRQPAEPARVPVPHL